MDKATIVKGERWLFAFFTDLKTHRLAILHAYYVMVIKYASERAESHWPLNIGYI